MDVVDGLRSIEEIRQVKYRYLRCVDLKLWDEIGDTLTEDATLDYGTTSDGRPLAIVGRPKIAAFFRAKFGPDTLTSHIAGQPEITVDGHTATGIWSLRETLLATKHRMLIAAAAFYHDHYERGADGWRIARTSYMPTYETMVSLDDLPSFKIIGTLAGAPDQEEYADAVIR